MILSTIKRTFGRKGFKDGSFTEGDFKHFAQGAEVLSTVFTEDRASISNRYFNDPVLRSGYLLYFLPVNLFKTIRLLENIIPHLPKKEGLSILDLGSGPGTHMLGIMAFYHEWVAKRRIPAVDLKFTLIDANAHGLTDARHFHGEYLKYIQGRAPSFKSSITTIRTDLKTANFPHEKYDLIMAGNVLNEINDRNARLGIASRLMKDHLDDEGLMLIMEPALRHPTRELQWLRDEVVTRGKIAHVLAPCLHQDLCPLNIFNGRDWCHFYLSWEAPEFVQKVDRLIKNKKEWLALSYLVLGRRDAAEMPRNTWRVISNMMHSRGKKELVLCGSPGRVRVTRLDRDSSKANGRFEHLKRGDVVFLDIGIKDAPFKADREYRLQAADEIRKVN